MTASKPHPYAKAGSQNVKVTVTDTAPEGNAGSWTSIPSLRKALYGLAAVTGPDGRIYAIGGQEDFVDPLSSLEAISGGVPQSSAVAVRTATINTDPNHHGTDNLCRSFCVWRPRHLHGDGER